MFCKLGTRVSPCSIPDVSTEPNQHLREAYASHRSCISRPPLQILFFHLQMSMLSRPTASAVSNRQYTVYHRKDTGIQNQPRLILPIAYGAPNDQPFLKPMASPTRKAPPIGKPPANVVKLPQIEFSDATPSWAIWITLS